MRLFTSRRVGPPIVAAAVATLVLTNFAMVMLVQGAGGAADHLFETIWPIALTSTVAVILVMSLLFRSIADLVAELKAREAAAQHQALHDGLTGLANRALLEDRLGQALHRHRRAGEQVALLMLDLDHFKQVNDTLGHPAGDELVRQVGTRLKALLRDTDTVARIGGDEFAILQAQPKGEADVRRLCERIIETIQAPFALGEREARIGVSIGAVLAGESADTATELLRHADITMYRAKAGGRNCYRLFSEAMDADAQRRHQIEAGLRLDLANGAGPFLHFQPVLGPRGEIVGVEGLMRWTRPALGTVPPMEIVPIAEECGLIEALGRRVVIDACAVARRWPDLSVAINLSPVQFRTPDFAAALKSLVESQGVACGQIELEITEALFIDHGDLCAPAIEQLRAAGFRVCLDDFGTGTSSLNSLRRHGIDKIKLDRSFVDAAARDRSIAMVRAAVTLGHAMDLEVVAEGIASAEEAQIALEAGCDGLQGFHFARPMAPEALDAFLAQASGARISTAA